MPAKLKIGVDFDDVLFPTNEHMLAWHNSKYGTSYKMEDIVSYDLSPLWGVPDEEVLCRIHEFYDTPEHAAMLPVELASDAIELLFSNGKESTIVTMRAHHKRDVTTKLVEKHFHLLRDRICFSSVAVGNELVRKSKKQYCQELGIDVFIDDCLDHALPVAGTGIQVLLFDRPWNQADDLPHNVTRVYSWDEIVMKLM